MSIQGFPILGKQLKIINKLNGMAITISEGWHSTKKDAIIVQRPDFNHRQTFKITQKGHSQLYFIEPVGRDTVLSPKSGWGDMVYSDVKLERYNEQTTQMWRIVPYDEVMYNQKNQQKHVFRYIPSLINPDQPKTNSANNLKLGYEFLPYKNQFKNQALQQAVSSQPKQTKQSAYKLGYEFESGPHVKAYDEAKTDQYKTLYQQSKISNPNSEVITPTRFPIKQKNNILPIDKDSTGWFFIENVKFNLVLEIEGGIDEQGMGIVLNRLYGNRNQLWKFV